MKRILLRLILPLILVLFPNLTFAQWMILSDTTWSGTILVDREVTIKPGKVLTVAAGSVLKMSKGASIHASGGGGVRLMGTNVSPVQVLPVIAGEQWGKIEVRDTGSAVEYHFAELYGGQTKIWNGATADLQDADRLFTRCAVCLYGSLSCFELLRDQPCSKPFHRRRLSL